MLDFEGKGNMKNMKFIFIAVMTMSYCSISATLADDSVRSASLLNKVWISKNSNSRFGLQSPTRQCGTCQQNLSQCLKDCKKTADPGRIDSCNSSCYQNNQCE